MEQKGKLAEGLKIRLALVLRLALVRCAKLMREQQRSKMPLLVSLPIAHIATIRPKGEPLPEAAAKRQVDSGSLCQLLQTNPSKRKSQLGASGVKSGSKDEG
ncbi:MAG: hypothetical protein NZ805_02130 [Armatimonadetes bacterium]|nr:hypothetical protein [Armatimonadota bacterium]MDW8026830.1 hypothetical protein [Armatimonadota bacterium]